MAMDVKKVKAPSSTSWPKTPKLGILSLVNVVGAPDS